MIMAQRPLLWQLFPSYLLITLFSLVAVTAYAYYIVSEIYLEVKSADLHSRVYLVENQVQNYLQYPETTHIDSLCKTIGAKSNTRLTIILPDGVVLADSEKDPKNMDNHGTRPEILKALNGDIGTSTRYSETLETELMYVAIPIKNKEKLLGVLRASVPLTFIQQTLSAIRIRIIYSAIIISIIVAVISLLFSQSISRPLEDIKNGVEKFARGELSFRFNEPRSKELGKLTDALNQMAAQLDEKIRTIVEQKNQQEAVLESMVESVIAVDRKGIIININQAAASIFRLNRAEALDKPVDNIINNKELVNLIQKTLSSSEPIEDEIYLKDEGQYFLQVHGTVLENSQNQVIGAVVVLNDVTRLRRLEKVRRDFVANVSHEIRTPLTSIKGFAETLLDGAIKDDETARGFVEIINKQSNRLNAIIEDLLTLARLEQEDERTQLEFNEYTLHKVLESAIEVCTAKAEQKSVELVMENEDPMKIRVNPDLLEQAIVNLIDNAIKFSSEKSQIIIDYHRNTEKVAVTVADSGVGIERKHLPRLFERFYRVDKARSRNMGGTGLGLAIVKHIAQVHGGNVSVESEPQKGSKFSIYIPLT
jgi:two-component system, OmpR family, phosphate regulon sensor histidine kinase PhoR